MTLTQEQRRARRFSMKIKREGECLIWTGPFSERGVPLLGGTGSNGSVRRYVWTLRHGSPKSGYYPYPTCGNPECVYIGHLELRLGTPNGHEEQPRNAIAKWANKLTEEQEREVIRLVGTGMTQKEVAGLLDVSQSTVSRAVARQERAARSASAAPDDRLDLIASAMRNISAMLNDLADRIKEPQP